MTLASSLTESQVRERLKEVTDPELGINIVEMGLIYQINLTTTEIDSELKTNLHILMTLTTPGCPLAGVIQEMVTDQFRDLSDFDVEADLHLELTFDPPWVPDMMSEAARAELGL